MTMMQTETLADYDQRRPTEVPVGESPWDYQPEYECRMVDTVELDCVDVTGLEGREAATLALLLKAWNPSAGKVYKYRNGRRYLTPAITRIDLNHPLVEGQPWAEDIEEIVRERHIPVEYEPIHRMRPKVTEGNDWFSRNAVHARGEAPVVHRPEPPKPKQQDTKLSVLVCEGMDEIPEGKDKRHLTSLANLAGHINAPLGKHGSSPQIGLRLSPETLAKLDAARGEMSRAEYVRNVLMEHLG